MGLEIVSAELFSDQISVNLVSGEWKVEDIGVFDGRHNAFGDGVSGGGCV